MFGCDQTVTLTHLHYDGDADRDVKEETTLTGVSWYGQAKTAVDSAITASAIGDGMIVYATPYARYLYYGEVYGPNIPIFEGGELAGFRSPPHKYPTGRPLTYNGAPDRGAYWFERAMAEHKDDVIREAAALAGGRPGR